MKVETPQILWHSSADEEGKAAPLYSVSLLDDGAALASSSSSSSSAASSEKTETEKENAAPAAVVPVRSEAVLATAGNTPEVNLWRIRLRPRSPSSSGGGDGDGDEDAHTTPGRILQDFARKGEESTNKTDVRYLVSLSRHHDRSVNAVRFSPDGSRLAAAGDGGSVVVYTPLNNSAAAAGGKPVGGAFGAWSSLEKETDVHAFLTSSPSSGAAGAADAIDLSWSPDSTRFAVACLDHSVSVFQLSAQTKGSEGSKWTCVHRNDREHTHYVQGVSYDPMGVYLASQGSDRTVRVWSRKKRSGLKNAPAALAAAAASSGEHGEGADDANTNNDSKDGKNELIRDALASSKFELSRFAKTIKFRACAAPATAATTTTTAQQASSKDKKKEDKVGEGGGSDSCGTVAEEKPENETAAVAAAEPEDAAAAGAAEAQQSTVTATNTEEAATATATSTDTTSKKPPPAQPRRARHCLYADESTVESFFRRLSWTPDGAFLVTPAALCHADDAEADAGAGAGEGGGTEGNTKPKEEPTFATYLYARHRFDAPYRVLHGLEKPSIAVRPNPVPFRLPASGSGSSPLPYRTIFAVLTLDSVLLYDTYHARPLCVARGLHYAALNDAAWTSDGTTLIVVSTDGYVSVLTFEGGELGEPYVAPTPKVPTPTPPQLMAGAVAVPTTELLPTSASATPGDSTMTTKDAEKTTTASDGATVGAKVKAKSAPQAGASVPTPMQVEQRKEPSASAVSAVAGAPPKKRQEQAPASASGDDAQAAVPPPKKKKQKKRIQPMLVSCS